MELDGRGHLKTLFLKLVQTNPWQKMSKVSTGYILHQFGNMQGMGLIWIDVGKALVPFGKLT